MTLNVGDEVEAYAAYLNARPRASEQMRHEELEQFDQDLGKARAQMERAWLENGIRQA